MLFFIINSFNKIRMEAPPAEEDKVEEKQPQVDPQQAVEVKGEEVKEGEAKVEQAEGAPAKKDEPSAAQPNPAKNDQKVLFR